MKIATKTQFYDLWQAGLLGNRPAAWPSLRDLQHSGFEGFVTIRYKGGAGGGFARTHVRVSEIGRIVEELQDRGLNAERLTFHESMPDELLLIQGEVTRVARGLELTYSKETNTPMREAMRRPLLASGLAASQLLNRFLDPNSRDDLEMLLEQYPDAVVEFGTYAVDVGVFPRRNTIIWEVRDY